MAKISNLPPGATAPRSGEYTTVGPRGGRGAEVTVPRGHTLPPTPKPNSSYTLTRPANNGAGRGK